MKSWDSCISLFWIPFLFRNVACVSVLYLSKRLLSLAALWIHSFRVWLRDRASCHTTYSRLLLNILFIHRLHQISYITSDVLEVTAMNVLTIPVEIVMNNLIFSRQISNILIQICLEILMYNSGNFEIIFYGPGMGGGGGTEAPFVNFSVIKIFDFAKITFRFIESHSYSTGVTAAELRRHLPNINVLFNG